MKKEEKTGMNVKTWSNRTCSDSGGQGLPFIKSMDVKRRTYVSEQLSFLMDRM